MEPAIRVCLCAAVLVSALACGAPRDAADEAPQPRRHPGLALGAREHSNPDADEGTSGDRRSADPETDDATKGDKKTFAYASSDGAAIAAEVTSVLAPTGGGTVHYEGYELLDDAEKLESMSNNARKRLNGVHPSHPGLVDARKDGMAAYSLTSEYARLMINLANADANDDLGALNAAANQALALEGRGEELAAYYTALITELEVWSRNHPQAAAEALKKYGG